jgi:hypothetical protein
VAETGQAPEAQVASMSGGSQLSRVPIVMAVTGHRNLRAEDRSALVEAVTGQLRELSRRHPHSPCMLLSALAEGADRLVARCALDAGWLLGVVLPLPQHAYECDFKRAESIEEFRALLGRADWVQVLSPPTLDRPACYVALGDWLCARAHVMMALWDGLPERGEGGTAEVVRRFREGVSQAKLVIPEAGPVIHVQAWREGDEHSNEISQSGRVQCLPPRPAGLTTIDLQRWSAALQRIDQFNREILGFDGATIGRFSVLPVPVGYEPVSSRLRLLFSVADYLAVQAQRDRSRMFRWLLSMAAIALLLAQVYSSLFTLPFLLCGAIALSLTAMAWYRLSRTESLEQRYLDYRALAEACKVQHFWEMAGIQDAVTDYYLREQSDELEWIRLAIRGTRAGVRAPGEGEGAIERLKWIRDMWLDDQRRYFLGSGDRKGKAAQNRFSDDLWSRRSRLLATTGATLMVLTAVFHLFIADLSQVSHDWLLRALMAAYSAVFGAAGLCKVYQHTTAFAEHAKKYHRTGQMLQVAISQLDAALESGDARAATEVIRAVGIEALDENGDWLLMHRERPVSAQGFG